MHPLNRKYVTTIPATGHTFEVEETAPTCTELGLHVETCSTCGELISEIIPATGHTYEITEDTEPTCTEEGKYVQVCSACGEEITEIRPATEHSLVSETTATSCTEESLLTETCTVCGETITETIPPAGHSYEIEETPATCTESGHRTETCSVCGDVVQEELPPTGHSFGDWQETKAPTVLSNGTQEHTCEACGTVETTELPKKTIGATETAVGIAVGVLGVLTAAVFLTQKFLAVRAAAATAKAVAAAESAFPGLFTLVAKRVLLCFQDNKRNKAFKKALINRPYLKVRTSPYGDTAKLKEAASEQSPDLIILSITSIEQLKKTAEELSAACKDIQLAVIDETGMLKEPLQAMKTAGTVMSFASASDNGEKRIAKMILPLYKPSQAGDTWAANATLITDALGLPIVSFLLNVYSVGDDVVEAVKNRGVNVADAADIVSDVACVLGLDVLSDLANYLYIGLEQKERLEDVKKESGK